MKTQNIERLILSGLIKFKDFSNIAITFTKPEYFEQKSSQEISKLILFYSASYNQLPTKESLNIELDKHKGLTQDEYDECVQVTNEIFEIEHDPDSLDYMKDTCETYYRNRAVYNAILEGISIIDGKNKQVTQEAIPEILQDALNVCFDQNVGHNYFENAMDRYIDEDEEKIPFKLDLLNKITNGGIPKKTLTVVAAISGGGKSMLMSDWSAYLLKKGYNVLYFTMELSEKKVAERIDANMFDMPMQSFQNINHDMFMSQIDKLKAVTKGRLYIKEYPSAAANVMDFRRTLSDLKLKQGFKPDIIFVDYLGICSSSRQSMGNGSNSYGLAKSIAEELRGMAQEYDLPVVTAQQLNRGSYGNSSEAGMDSISDSIGIAFTADLMLSVYSDEELKANNQAIITQLKNRFGDPDKYKRFIVGQDSSRMKFFDNIEENDMAIQNVENASTGNLPNINSFDVNKTDNGGLIF